MFTTGGSTVAAAAALEAAFGASSTAGDSQQRAKTQMAAQSRTMLAALIDELRGSPAVDLAGKNLLDEGVEYVAEGLAYNDVCKVVRFGSNAAAQKACYQLGEALKVSLLLPCLLILPRNTLQGPNPGGPCLLRDLLRGS